MERKEERDLERVGVRWGECSERGIIRESGVEGEREMERE